MKVACYHWKYWKFQINWKTLEYVVPIKINTKKTPFCITSRKLFPKMDYKRIIGMEIYVIKPIDDVVLRKRKAMIEGRNDQSKNLEMDILDEGALVKALKVTENT